MAQYGYYFTKEETNKIAKKFDWKLVDWQENIYMVSYKKLVGESSIARVNIYLTTMTVGTSLEHPKKGKTQLFRKVGFDRKLLEKIFKNPRQHTGKGYYKKKA